MLFEGEFNEPHLNILSAWFAPKNISRNLEGNALDFYGSFINLRRVDKVRALENELVRDLAWQFKVQTDKMI